MQLLSQVAALLATTDGSDPAPAPPPPPPPPAVPLSAILSPTYAYGERLGPGYVETWKSALEATGGVSPYTYAAAYVSGDTLDVAVANNEVWFGTELLNGRTKSAVYSFTVTDYDYTAVTTNLNVELVSERTGPTGPGGITRDPEDPTGLLPTSPPPAPPPPPVADIVVFATPAYAYGERTGAGDVTTNTLVFSISGGSPPYTIVTSYIQGESFTINGGTTTSVSFTKTGLAENDNFLGWYQFLVTDSAGRTGRSVVSAQIRAWEVDVVDPEPPSPPPPPPPPPAALAASASPFAVSGERLGPGLVTTNSVTITASNGTPPYSYTMVYVSGNSFTINNPATGLYSFSRTFGVAGSEVGTYRWTVTDAAAGSVTGTITASLAAISTRDPGGDRELV